MEQRCMSKLHQIAKDIVWQPAPPILIVDPSFSEGCAPLEVAFNNLSSPLDSTYEILWTFENLQQSSSINSSHIYQQPGIYNVSLSITSPIGCTKDTTYKNLINVEPPPVAHFEYEIEEVEFETYEITFHDNSQRVEAWQLTYNQQLFTNIILIPPRLSYF